MEETPSFSWHFSTSSEPKWVPRHLGCRRPPTDDRRRVKAIVSLFMFLCCYLSSFLAVCSSLEAMGRSQGVVEPRALNTLTRHVGSGAYCC
ncbi:Taste receptor type 2 member 7 [Gossypium arboreum]|uniref:Taste receptor type 2 member 7 n=1 Tax=Gossypium arboreum TaxID=29729 RepID=A0A0B0N1K2_GOSAR|nr:Taste receptor type 2 member 7 [Gossypium arboreum]